MLIGGKMFDIGMYVAITSADPLRVYVYDNVLLRFCSKNYTTTRSGGRGHGGGGRGSGGGVDGGGSGDSGSGDSTHGRGDDHSGGGGVGGGGGGSSGGSGGGSRSQWDDAEVDLDADLNAYVIADDYLPPWNVPELRQYYSWGMTTKSALKAHLVSIGEDPTAFFGRIHRVVAETMVRLGKRVAKAAGDYPNGQRNFFQLLRMDLIVDANLQPWLIEMNQSPNLSPAHFPDLANMFDTITSSLLSLRGLLRHQINWPCNTPEDEAAFLPTHQVDISYAVCHLCKDTCTGHVACAAVCRRCRTPAQTRMIKELIAEERGRGGFLRLGGGAG